MYLLSSVACLYHSLRNEQVWFLFLNLKVVSQSPMYVSFVVAVVTSALQFPSIGHKLGLRQLQFFF